jgi:hypothetical protein
MANHADLTGSDLHEPKGVSGASAGKVYVADGAGSGSWTDLDSDALVGLNNKNLIWLQARITDLSGTESVYVPCPLAGTITKVTTVLQGAIATSNATLRLQINGSPVTDSTVTIANASSAAGDVDTATPTGANTVTADSAIEVDCLGTGTTAEAAEVLIQVDVS